MAHLSNHTEFMTKAGLESSKYYFSGHYEGHQTANILFLLLNHLNVCADDYGLD